MARTVREPIQVYLTPDERQELDEAAASLGVSRSEALRQGIDALRRGRRAGSLRHLAESGLVTPASGGGPEPPPSRPVSRWRDLSAELTHDREDR